MGKKIKLHEKFLYEIWKGQNFSNDITTEEGEEIEVLNAGIKNKELGGPDFLNARIKIGSITYLGDVEIDILHSDWKNHGHYLNKKYNKVILHIVLNNNSRYKFVHTQDNRKVPTVCLTNFLNNTLRKNIQEAISSEHNTRMNKMLCFEINQVVNEKEKLNFLYDLGLKRFKQKSEKMLLRLKELTYLKELSIKEPVIKYDFGENFYNKNFTQAELSCKDIWLQLIYESIFEALGYSNNKDIMKNLAKSANISFLKKFRSNSEFISYIEAALFNISGLLPDVSKLPDSETSTYTRKLYQIWTEIKKEYDGRMYHETQWHFFQMRPQNFPTIRIVGGARIVYRLINGNLIPQILHKIEDTSDMRDLARELRQLLIVTAEDYWQRHYVFDQPSNDIIKNFIGTGRADEILINVLLPIISVYFDLFNRKNLSRKVIKLYVNFYQESDNKLVDELSSALSLNGAWKRSILYQGLIELFRNYCLNEKCLECKIGAKVFG